MAKRGKPMVDSEANDGKQGNGEVCETTTLDGATIDCDPATPLAGEVLTAAARWQAPKKRGRPRKSEQQKKEKEAAPAPVEPPPAAVVSQVVVDPNKKYTPEEAAEIGRQLSEAKRFQKDPSLYCICKKPLSDRAASNGMIQCIACKDWYHFSCVGFIEGGRRGAGGGYKCEECKSFIPPVEMPEPEPEEKKKKRVKVEEVYIDCRQCEKHMNIRMASNHKGGTVSKKQARHWTSYLCGDCNAPKMELQCLCRRPADETSQVLQCTSCCSWYHYECLGLSVTSPALREKGWDCPICLDTGGGNSIKRYCLCQRPYERARTMYQCIKCTDWYHPECLGIPLSVNLMQGFICTVCSVGRRLYCLCRQPEMGEAERQMIQCDGCQDWFHMDCLAVDPMVARRAHTKWSCHSCTKRKEAMSRGLEVGGYKKVSKVNTDEVAETTYVSFPGQIQIPYEVVLLPKMEVNVYNGAVDLVDTMACLAEDNASLQPAFEIATAAIQACDKQELQLAVKQFNSAQRRSAALVEEGQEGGLEEGASQERAGAILSRICSSTQVAHILGQVYTVVVEDPKSLTHYKAFTAEVYGEANAGLVNEIIQTSGLKDGDVFLDMGSGVGQVVLQVAAQCKVKQAVGIELRDAPADYANPMGHEFSRRMGVYGKEHAPFTLIKGNFLDLHDLPDELLQSVDVCFVNNVAFESSLNRSLMDRFMVMKPGARVVSLVSFGKRTIKTKSKAVRKLGKDKWYFSCDGCGSKGENLDDGERMVECFQCGVWQHTRCNGIQQTSRISSNWMCQKCSWAGQKQARDANQDFFSVEGPFVCDLKGAVSWTSSVINYFILTINDTSNRTASYVPGHAAAEGPSSEAMEKKPRRAKQALKPKLEPEDEQEGGFEAGPAAAAMAPAGGLVAAAAPVAVASKPLYPAPSDFAVAVSAVAGTGGGSSGSALDINPYAREVMHNPYAPIQAGSNHPESMVDQLVGGVGNEYDETVEGDVMGFLVDNPSEAVAADPTGASLGGLQDDSASMLSDTLGQAPASNGIKTIDGDAAMVFLDGNGQVTGAERAGLQWATSGSGVQ